MHLRTFLVLSCLGLLAACASQQAVQTPSTPPPAGPSPAAQEVLQRMTATLTGARSLAFNVDVLREVETHSGARAHLVSHDTVIARHPDRMRADLRGDAHVANVYYDGRRVVVEELNANLYAATDAPPDVNGTIDMLEDRLGIPLTVGVLLRTDVYNQLMENARGDLVASSMLDGRPTDHLLMSSGPLTWELWVSRGERALPAMLVINRDGLRTLYRFSNWRLNPAIPESAFHYAPRPGASEIPFVPLRASQRG